MKLYHLTDSNFSIVDHVDQNGAIVTTKIGSIPIVLWPNGHWCYEANAFIFSLVREGKSRRTRGGTLLTYVAHISHLLRYCAGFGGRGTNLIDLTDGQFTAFIQTLKPLPESEGSRVNSRDLSHVRTIGLTCLQFLRFVGELHGNRSFVSPGGQINVFIKKNRRSVPGLGWRPTESISHAALPIGNPFKRRLPISDDDITRLRRAVHPLGGSGFVKRRRLVMLTLLEVTLGRRVEVASILVDDVLKAARMTHPEIRMLTAKRRLNRNEYRMVPVSRADLKEILDYISTSRRLVVRRTCGESNSDGLLLVSETTGLGISTETVTTELSLLKRKAGIPGQACAHMFRHAGITKMLVTLIRKHDLRNPDDFRRALLDVEDMKARIQQITGWTSVESIEPYLHLAMRQAYGVNSKIDDVSRDRKIASALQKYRSWNDAQGESAPTVADAKYLRDLLEALSKDLGPSGEA